MTERGGANIFCRILAPRNAPPPSPEATVLNNLNDREGAPLYPCRMLAPLMPPPPTPQYLTILMTERGGAIIFVGFWRPPMPPLSRCHNTSYLDDRERRRHYLCRILVHPMPPTLPPQTPRYLTILMTKRGGAIIFYRILAPPNDPPPPPHTHTDAIILNYLNDRERGGGQLQYTVRR